MSCCCSQPAAAVPTNPKIGHHMEELRASVNFETPDGQDACGNKINPGENLTPVFTNNYDKLYSAVDKTNGFYRYTECKDMTDCDETVHWLFKLSGKKTEALA